jgi:Tol biopolymer transport system component
VNFAPLEDAPIDTLFATPVPITEINSTSVDDDPSMTGDLLELFFISSRSGSGRLWVATRSASTDPWGTPQMVTELDGASINNAKVSYDGLGLVFSSSRAPNAGGGNDDIWLATRPDRSSPWTPARIDELAVPETDYEPWLPRSNGPTIYFNSGRTGSTQFYQATRASPSDPFGTPVLLDTLGSSNYDGSLWVDDSGRFGLFHSDRTPTRKIFYATRGSPDEQFSAPQLFDELNSAGDDSDPWLSPDLRNCVFTSTRDGNEDIYFTSR